jgi:hypothetical protein
LYHTCILYVGNDKTRGGIHYQNLLPENVHCHALARSERQRPHTETDNRRSVFFFKKKCRVFDIAQIPLRSSHGSQTFWTLMPASGIQRGDPKKTLSLSLSSEVTDHGWRAHACRGCAVVGVVSSRGSGGEGATRPGWTPPTDTGHRQHTTFAAQSSHRGTDGAVGPPSAGAAWVSLTRGPGHSALPSSHVGITINPRRLSTRRRRR